jgi:deoxyribonuclease-4
MSIAGGVSHALDRAGAVKSNAVQLFTKNNRQWNGPPVSQKDVERWQSEMAAQQIAYAVSHASYLINLASPKEELWEKSIRAHRDELERAHAYGIRHVVLHPGAHTGSGMEAGIARIAEALNRIHEETPECSDTMTLLELMAGQGTTIGSTFAELRAIIDQVDAKERVGVCLDTCHAYAAGYELNTPQGYAAMMDELDRDLGIDQVRCWHFNDSLGALASHRDRHTHIGEGEIGVEGFRLILNDPRWEGLAMLLETPKKKDPDDDIRNLRVLCQLVEDTSRIPEGLNQG